MLTLFRRHTKDCKFTGRKHRNCQCPLAEAWKIAPVTMQKRLEMLRSFFRFCVDSGWIDRNPAKVVRLPVVEFEPTLPFAEQDMENILWACEMVRDKHPAMDPGIEKKLRVLVLLMRYSGLRITDAVTIKKGHIKDGKVFLYQTKTKQPVWAPVPDVVLDALKEIDEGREYYFWTGPANCATLRRAGRTGSKRCSQSPELRRGIAIASEIRFRFHSSKREWT
jgi:integrase